MARWSSHRFGGFAPVDLQSAEFSRKLADLFLDKYDPQRLLFTAKQVRDFSIGAHRGWKEVLNSESCEYFDRWAHQYFPQAKRDLILRASRLLSKGTSVTKHGRYVPGDFANDEHALNIRLERFVGSMLSKQFSPALLLAYGKNQEKFILDTLDQLIDEDVLEPKLVLAKAVLGAFDRFSSYLSAAEFEDFYDELVGSTTGLGIQIRKVPSGFFVEKVLKQSPADHSGKLKVGDIITAIETTQLSGLKGPAVKKLLRGAENEPVRLEVSRFSGNGLLHFPVTIRRGKLAIEEASVTHRLVPISVGHHTGSVGVIHLQSFYGKGGLGHSGDNRSASEELEAILSRLVGSKNPPVAVVLDLRGNPGGFLDEAVSIGGLFLGNRPVVGVIEQGKKRILSAQNSRPLYNGPLTVLVDENSASASEVLAGALKDHQRALLVGSKHTFGKGSVQRLFHLDDEVVLGGLPEELRLPGVVKLTTSLFYSPLGHSPSNGGVVTHLSLSETNRKTHVEDAGSDNNRVSEITDNNASSMCRLTSAETSKKRTEAVPEALSFVEGTQLEEIQNKEAAFRLTLEKLQHQCHLRITSDLKRWPVPKTIQRDWMLSAAVEVSLNLARIQKEAAFSTHASKESGFRTRASVRKPSRNVISY
ncbi:MAG: PDZ domain-containing protein [Deltaproteobacteria bacterium]|nr:PDZ domain-containing protein [Deltaproteobacteria bacterium]